MVRVKLVGALAALGILSGCVGSDIDAMRTAEGTGSPFTQALTEEYRQIVLFEADEMYDWPDAGYFARKGLAAAGGEVVAPEEVSNWNLPADHVDELSAARADLVSLLDAGARDRFPELAARAQGRYDCWIEQQEENHQPDHIAACRDEFYAAMEELRAAMNPAMAAPAPFVVYFAFDRANLTDEGAGVVNDAVAYAQREGLIEFSVTGHADRAGSEDYNVRLSLRRANTVADALVAKGILPQNISVAGRGEADNAVPTADGVPEQGNRRVEIVVQ
jgi:OOP family OmpA-OmpF porin